MVWHTHHESLWNSKVVLSCLNAPVFTQTLVWPSIQHLALVCHCVPLAYVLYLDHNCWLCGINQMCRLALTGTHLFIWESKSSLDKWHMHHKIETQKYSRSVYTKWHMPVVKTQLMQHGVSPRINFSFNINCCVRCRLLKVVFFNPEPRNH